MQSTKQKYGWRPSLPDYRDYVYRVPAHHRLELPQAVNLDSPALAAPFNPSIDQDQLGACGPNAEANDIVVRLLQAGGIAREPSRLFLYYTTRQLMGTTLYDSGVDNRTMLKALKQFGYAPESMWPYNIEDFTTEPPQVVYDQAAKTANAITYEAVPQDLDAMRSCLAGGSPFIFGFTVYDSFESPEVTSTGDVPMPRPRERVLGGHDVLFIGYDDVRQVFIFRNSWGPNWGKGGTGTMPYAYATNPDLAGDFWRVIAASPAPAPVPPTPTPSPGPSPTPTPTPTPPAPIPTPADIKAAIDKIFAAIEARTRRPAVVAILKEVNAQIDQYLSTLPTHGSAVAQAGTLQDQLDMIFAYLIKHAKHPFAKQALELVQGIVDAYLAGH